MGGRADSAGVQATVAFNALPCDASSAGVSTYIRELLGALRSLLPGPMVAAVATGSEADLPFGVEAVPRSRARGALRALQGLRDLARASVFHGLDVDLPAFTRAATVATVHDLAVFDVAATFPRHRVLGERLIVTAALRHADAVIAVSDFTAERLAARFKVEAVVIPEAPRPVMRVAAEEEVAAIRRRYDLPESFAFHVGTCEPRKNLAGVAEACDLAGLPLVLVGPAGWKCQAPPDARHLGFVPSDDLPALYGAATMSVYYSGYEGFGLPPLDSMACGCPVVTTAVPSVGLAPQGAVVVPARNPERLAKALRELANDGDRRRELGREGRRAVAPLTWAATARQTVDVYRSLDSSVVAA